MTRAEIMEAANRRGFTVETTGGTFPASLSGHRLDFPRVHALNGAINVEISWNLAERLASGESVRVLA